MKITYKKIAICFLATIILFSEFGLSYLYLPFNDHPFLIIYPFTFLSFVLFGFIPSIFAVSINILIYIYIFNPPYYTFEVADNIEVVSLFFYLIVSVIIGFYLYKMKYISNELLETNIRLDEALNSQKQFVENAAHQLRTPLAGLKLNADYALTVNDYNDIKPILIDIQESTNRATNLVTQLLSLARAESNASFILTKNDLKEITKSCIVNWISTAFRKNINIVFDSPKYPIYIMCDELLIYELISNLISNSINYGQHGGNINVKITDNENKICISIEDNGIGISDNEIQNIFKRFYRISNVNGLGCGLGLSIVKQIADVHNANINIISGSICDGTTINIEFKKCLFSFI
ncbi:MAG: HAMP domain-containing histidine kinase [Methylococcales bacterium]|jgi:signal transduction histidine kinase|nr:HAMP domain-containing histidine kinase [Methylococcales bacterium]